MNRWKQFSIVLLLALFLSSSILGYLYVDARARLLSLMSDYEALSRNYFDLEAMYNGLNQAYEELNETYTTLKHEYGLLNASYRSLSLRYEMLEADFTLLLRSYSELENAYLELSENYTRLRSDYEGLDKEYSDLESDYETLKKAYEGLLEAQEDLKLWYERLRSKVNFRILANMGEECERYITPQDPLVVETVFKIVGRWANQTDEDGVRRDFKKIFDWVRYDIVYSSDPVEPWLPLIGGEVNWTRDYWRFPNETITEKTGDCEDQALLLSSMLKAYTGNSKPIWCIAWSNETVGHLAVAILVDDEKLCIMDPAGGFYIHDDYGRLTGLPVEEAVEKWLNYWNTPGAYVCLVFDEDERYGFDCTAEFIRWFKTRYG